MVTVTCAKTWLSSSLSVWLQASSPSMLVLLLVLLMAGRGVTGVMVVGSKGLNSLIGIRLVAWDQKILVVTGPRFGRIH